MGQIIKYYFIVIIIIIEVGSMEFIILINYISSFENFQEGFNNKLELK